MSRVYGTVSMGLRAPIIRQGDDLIEIVTGSVVEAMNVSLPNALEFLPAI